MNNVLFPVAILAGGLATRLRPITETIPKALIDINGEPFIAHQMRLLKNKGIGRVVICTGYLGEMIQNFLKDGKQFGIKIDYVFDGEKLLGTGGALKNALPLLEEHFFVLYGDSYLPCNYQQVQKKFIESNKQALMTVFHNKGCWDTSNVDYRDGEIFAYDKKNLTPTMQYIDYGLGIFNHEAFTQMPNGEAFDLAQLYQNLLQQKQLAACEIKERFYEAGSVKGLEEIKQLLYKKENLCEKKQLL